MNRDLPILVINLDRAEARLASMRRQLEGVGLQDRLGRVAAVDAAVPEFSAPGYAPGGYGDRWSLLPVEQAIFESHRVAWQVAVDQGGAVICEDDLMVSASLPAVLPELDLARFGVIKLDGFFAARRYGPKVDMGAVHVREIRETVPSAACYALSAEAARQLLADSERYAMTLDDYVFQPRAGLTVVQLCPAVAVQEMCVTVPVGERASAMERASGRDAKGPALFRLRKELRRGSTRLRRRLGGDKALLAEGGVIARPDLAADLPKYRQ